MTVGAEGRTRREIATGTIWSAMGWVVATLAGPALVVVLVRRMTRVEFGSLAGATSAVGLAVAITGLGLGPALARYGAVARAQGGGGALVRLWRASRRVVLLATGAAAANAVVLLLLGRFVVHLRPSFGAIAVSVPALVAAPAAGAAGGYLRAAFRPRWTTLASVTGSLLASAVILPSVVVTRPPAWLVATGRTAGTVGTAAVLLIGIRHFRRRYVTAHVPARTAPAGAEEEAGDPPDTRRIVLFGAALQLGTLYGTVVAELGVIVLSASQGTRAAALFAPAAGVAATVLAIPGLMAGFLLPGLAPAAERADHREVGRLFHRSSRWEIVVLSPLLAVLVVSPESLLRVLFGAGLVGGTTSLRVLGIGCIAQVVFGFNGLTVSSYGMAGLLARLQTLDVVVAIAAVGALVPVYGMLGAAWAATTALVFSNAVYAVVLWRRFGIAPADVVMAVTILALGVALGAAFLVLHLVAGDLARCVVVGVLGGAATAATSIAVSGREERRRLLALLARRLRGQRAAA